MDQHELLHNALIYLLAAVIAVPLSNRLGLGSVLGYLFAGAVIGPWGLGLISNVEDILHFAEFGVVLLLFLIGLELNLDRLWALRRPILGTGGAQVVLTTGVLAGAGLLLGLAPATALIAGMALSLSSTAIALQTLQEKNLLATESGHGAFSVLLFQDLAVIPMLALIPVLGDAAGADDGNPFIGFVKALAVIAVIVAGGHYLLRPLLRLVAASNSREIFTASALLLVIGTALLVDSAGLSMALGTFLAGVLLADSEYRHELEIDLEPFKGLLLGLFFIAVGMTIDFGLLVDRPLTVLGLMLGLVLLKLALLLALGHLTGLRGSDNLLFGFILAQGGEFAFVLLGAALAAEAMPRLLADTLIVAVVLSMLVTPLLMLLYERLLVIRARRGATPAADAIEAQRPVVIAGFGRFGQIIVRLLHAKGVDATVIDHDPGQIELVRRFGYKAYYGDISRIDLLRAAGLERARLFILAIDDTATALATAKRVRAEYPQVRIMARVRNRQDVYDFMRLDVPVIVRETFGSALDMGEEALKALGIGAYRARRIVQRFRRHDLETIRHLYPHHQDEPTLISKTKEAREDLARLMRDEGGTPLTDSDWD